MPQVAAAHYRFSVTDFHRMGEAGILGEDARVELIDGELLEMTPNGSRHAGTVAKLGRILERAVGDAALVWTQNPLMLGDRSQPEPDLVLLRPREDFYTESLPQAGDALLVIEIADSSSVFDREVKLPLYARHGIAEAWLVDLITGRLEIGQEPGPSGYQRILRPENVGAVTLPGLEREVDLSALL